MGVEAETHIYLAGVLDAVGYIVVGYDSPMIGLMTDQKDLAMLFKITLGGVVLGPASAPIKPVWRWYVTGAKCERAASALTPYLRRLQKDARRLIREAVAAPA